MLRIITKKHRSGYRLELHGVLGREWVPLLQRHWRAIADGTPSARVLVVLSDVEFIDADGEELLRRMALEGVEFVASGCMNRHIIEMLRPAARWEEPASPPEQIRKTGGKGTVK